MWHRAPYKEWRPKEMSNLHAFVVGWIARGNCGKVVKLCGEAEGR